MNTVVHRPPRRHNCGVQGSDPVGTVRACECGKTWVAHDPPEVYRGQQSISTEWRPEGRFARWWRERRGTE